MEATRLFARFKLATGGARWDSVASIESEGTLLAGGLSGPITLLQETGTGRSTGRYQLGSFDGGQGFDGTKAWTKDPGGEVRILDAPHAHKVALMDAWMNALGYFYPTRAPATLSPVRKVSEGDARYLVVKATPAGGSALTMFFDAENALLVRTTSKREGDTVTTTFDDYRSVDGVRVPFVLVTNHTDAAGRTDARARTETRFERVVLNPKFEDNVFAMPAMTKSASIANAEGATQLPFELIDDHIYASLTIDGTQLRVIVDTGGVNLLTPTAAKRLGVASEGKISGKGAGDQRMDVSLAHVGQARLGDAILSNPVFYVIDMGPLAVDLDGLVGFEMFRRFRVTIDYAGRTLTLTDPAKFSPPLHAQVLPFELADRIPIITGTLDGLPVQLSVDTGARGSLSMHSPFVREHNLVARYSAAAESVVGWGVGGPVRGHPARLGTLKLGNIVVRDIAGDLFTGNKGAFANPDVSGNLGGGVLRRFTVTFDYDAKKMYLVPNADFGKADDFDRSGMWLMKDGEGMRVFAVTPQGPAEKAGVKQDDQIVEVGDEAVGARSAAEWRARFRELPAGTKLKLTVVRAKRQLTLTLRLANLIPPHAQTSP